MKTRLTFFCFFFVLLSSVLKAEEPVAARKLIFEENKNQWPAKVLFEADFGAGKLFLEKNTFTYLLIEKVDFHSFQNADEAPPKIRYHSFKVNFLNSNPEAAINGNTLYPFHRNYYLGDDPRTWAEGVKLYEEVSYKGLYPFIDMKVYNSDQNLKYDLIVNPGGKAEDIQFKYDGADRLYIDKGNLNIQTSLGLIIEQKPYAYQVIDGVKKEVACSYELKKQTLGFSVQGQYDKTLPLIIDPILVASTYTGSFADNWGFTATYDAGGNIYSAGIAASAGYPTTLGAWDNTFNGGLPWTYTTYPYDISITKFNANGTAIMFSTYYGGSKNEQPHSLMVNNNNELFVAGRTNSPNFPSTIGVYDATYNAGYDIIVGKFSPTGALLASTFLGGTGDDGVNIDPAEPVFGSLKFNYADDGRSEIILDNSSNVYVAACTRSTNFPTSTGAYDATLGGSQDGCVFKMNSTLTTLDFSTYLGGSADDAAYGLKLDPGNVLYVTGGTASTNFPTTPGVLNPAYKGGAADGFITAINGTGTALLYSTYLGTSAYDQSYLIETDANNDIYVYGQTKGAYPVTPGVYSNPNSGQFIHKLNKQLNTTFFSTVIGSGTPNPNISPTAFLVDSCQSIYIAGWARCGYAFGQPSPSSTTGMPITPNAYKTVTDGCDFYFMVLRPNAQSLLYATFFGENSSIGDHVDGGTSRFDKRGFIYQSVCASCGGSDQFPTTTTAWSRTNNSSNCNNAVIKMDLQVHVDAFAAVAGAPNGCVPFTEQFVSTGSLGTSFKWNFGDGSPIVSGTSPSHTYVNTGTYIATLYVTDTTGTCGDIDSSKITIKVGSPPTLLTSQTAVFCNGGNNGTATVTPAGGLNPYSYLWSSGNQTSATATGLTAGTHTVTVTNSYGCAATTTVTITQSAVLSVNTTFTNVGCFGGANGTATATVSGGTGPYTYSWLPGGYTASSVSGLSIGNYTVNVMDSKGCNVSGTANITQPPVLSITPVTTDANCGQSNGSASVTGTGGFAPYTWTWAGGQTGALVTGLAAGTYTVTIHDANLCVGSLPVSIANISGPSASVVSSDVSCNGASDGSATITTTGGTLPFTYLWNDGQTTPTATNLGAGIYSVIATDQNNCSATASVTITEPSLLIVNAIGTDPSCFGLTDGSVLASALGGTSPYLYSWAISGGSNTASVTGLGNGIYNVTATDAKGCIKQASVSLVAPPAITTFVSVTNVSCVGACNGTIAATATNGFTPYFYAWSDTAHQATPTATNLCAGTYSLAITDAHGCSSNAAATVGSPPVLTSSFASIGNASCFGLCDGFAQVTPVGGTPPYNYNWLPGGATTATSTGLCAGTFTCTITDAQGCTTIATDTITEPEQLVGAVNVLKIPCNGICDGEIEATFSGGTAPYGYLWTPGLQITNNPTTMCAGSNTVTVTDANGCSVNGVIVLTEPPPLSISTSTTNANCGQANGEACAIVTGGTMEYKYQWSSGLTDTLDCVTGLLANSYNVKVTDGMGCTITTNASINDVTGPIVAIPSSTDVSCFGFSDGTATTTISGAILPYNLSWTPGGQTVQNPTNLNEGTHTLTVTDNAGCVGSASVVINSPAEIVSAITSVQNISCSGMCDGAATALYAGGTGSLSLIWDSPGSPSSPTVGGLCAGTYHITITDSMGCVKTDSTTVITEPNALLMQGSTVTDILCYGENNGIISVAVGGGTPFYTFNWTPNVSAGATATNLTAGNYTLNITDQAGCFVTQTWAITEPPLLTLTSSTNSASCSLSNGDAAVIPNGGTAPYYYQWNDFNIQTTAVAQNLYSGSYVCTVTDTNGCSVTDTIAVAEISGPMIDSIATAPALCNGGNSGSARVFPTVGLGTLPFTYLWTPSSQTSDQAINLVQGAYTVVITDANGCTTNGIGLISQPPPLSIVVSPSDTVCYGDTAQIYAQAVGGTPAYTYFWTGASGAGLSGSGPHTVMPVANTIYSVNVSDANGCVAGPATMQVFIPLPLVLTSAPDLTICDGDSGTVSVTVSGGNGGPYLYTWNNGATTQSQTVNPSLAASPVSYNVIITDGCSQPVSDTINVIVQASPTGSFTQSSISGCEPLTVDFNAISNTPGVTYTWDFDDLSLGSGASMSHTFINDTVYSVTLTITTAAGCTTTVVNANSITVNPSPDADFLINPSPASLLYPLVTYTDQSTVTISSWLWNFNDSTSSQNISTIKNPQHTYNEVGVYTTQLIVTNQFGCVDTASKSVEVKEEFVFYAPNSFTPNDDDVNDVFLPVGVGYDINSFRFYIFDRWGELIFYSDDHTKGWNGIAKKGPDVAQIDVYVWKVNLTDNSGKKHKYIGHVTLLK